MKIQSVNSYEFAVLLVSLIGGQCQFRAENRSLPSTYSKLFLRKAGYRTGQRREPYTWKACDLGSIEKISRRGAEEIRVIRGRSGHGLRIGRLSKQEEQR
jgi:hypothetical protein